MIKWHFARKTKYVNLLDGVKMNVGQDKYFPQKLAADM